jgi:hypothetical protein
MLAFKVRSIKNTWGHMWEVAFDAFLIFKLVGMYSSNEFVPFFAARKFNQEGLRVKFGFDSLDVRILGRKLAEPIDFIRLNCKLNFKDAPCTYQSNALQVD